MHHGGLDEDQLYWSSDDEAVSEDIHSVVPGMAIQLHHFDNEDGGVAEEADPKVPGVTSQLHRVYNTKYGSKQS